MRPLWLLAVVGCGAEGVFVEVDTRGVDGVESVELVVAKGLCQDPKRGGDCQSIQGEGFASPLGKQGDLYGRTASAFTDQLDDGIASFELFDGDVRLAMAFAIARGANGIVGVAVLADTIDLAAGPVIYRVALDPSEELRDRNKRPGFAAAAEWGDDRECVGIDPLRSTLEPQRPVFILPQDNPDCDSRSDDLECDPLWFDGFSFDEGSAAHCVQPTLGDPDGPCLLGHVPNCVDNEANGSVPSCIQSAICLPGSVCTLCTDPLDEACVEQVLGDAGNQPHLLCTPNGEPDGNGNLRSCIDGSSLQNEMIILPDPELVGNATCTGAQLVEMPGITLHSQRSDTFADVGASFAIIDLQPDCTVKLKWEGAIPIGEAAHTLLTYAIDVNNSSREIWIPINFQPGGACNDTTANPCLFVSDQLDTITQCAAP